MKSQDLFTCRHTFLSKNVLFRAISGNWNHKQILSYRDNCFKLLLSFPLYLFVFFSHICLSQFFSVSSTIEAIVEVFRFFCGISLQRAFQTTIKEFNWVWRNDRKSSCGDNYIGEKEDSSKTAQFFLMVRFPIGVVPGTVLSKLLHRQTGFSSLPYTVSYRLLESVNGYSSTVWR